MLISTWCDIIRLPSRDKSLKIYQLPRHWYRKRLLQLTLLRLNVRFSQYRFILVFRIFRRLHSKLLPTLKLLLCIAQNLVCLLVSAWVKLRINQSFKGSLWFKTLYSNSKYLYSWSCSGFALLPILYNSVNCLYYMC